MDWKTVFNAFRYLGFCMHLTHRARMEMVWHARVNSVGERVVGFWSQTKVVGAFNTRQWYDFGDILQDQKTVRHDWTRKWDLNCSSSSDKNWNSVSAEHPSCFNLLIYKPMERHFCFQFQELDIHGLKKIRLLSIILDIQPKMFCLVIKPVYIASSSCSAFQIQDSTFENIFYGPIIKVTTRVEWLLCSLHFALLWHWCWCNYIR